MTYHVARNNQQLGAFAKEDTLARYNRGEILPTDLVWTEGMSTWQPASQIFGAPIVPDGEGIPAPATPPPFTVPFPDTPPPAPMTAHPALDLPPIKPDNNLIGAILATIFCCWPLGIPAIVFAAQVDAKYNKGDYAGAEESAKKSRTWMWWSIGSILVAALVGFLISIIGAASKH